MSCGLGLDLPQQPFNSDTLWLPSGEGQTVIDAAGRERAQWRENTEAKQRYLIDQFVINLLPSSCCLAATQ